MGFTREETRSVLAYYGLEDYAEHAARNYDGYNFGYVPMYCPWDVMSFCNANYRNVGRPGREVTVGNYWLNTSGNDVIEEFMGFISPEELDMLQDLLDGRHIRTVISPALCYGDLSLHRVKDFWTLLLFTGYLTADLAFKPEKRDEYSLYIPNEEIRDCFRTKILDFFACNPVMQNHAEEFARGLFSGDEVLVQNCLRGLLAKYVRSSLK